MREVRAEMQCTPTPTDHPYPTNPSERRTATLPHHDYHSLLTVPDEMSYADDADFVSKSIISQRKINKDVGSIVKNDPWRKKLHSLIFNDLMPLLVLIDKDWSLYVWSLSFRMKFCLLAQPEYTSIKTFETIPVPSNYPTLHDGIFQNVYESLVAQIEAYEGESKSIIVRALHLEFLADHEEEKERSDDDDDIRDKNCTIL